MEVNSDWISLLPEALLMIIISLIPFKDAVRTSVLSKRWLNIYRLTTNIELHESSFVKLDQPQLARESQRRDFLHFVNSWIDSYQEMVVSKFSLKLSKPNEVPQVVERCIDFALKRGVKELKLDFSDPEWEEDLYDDHEALVELPPYVYENNNGLEHLELFSCSFVERNLHHFHALREVSFGWMAVQIDSILTLLSNCKMVESLSLKKCWDLEDFDLGGRELKLTKLVVDKCNLQFDFFKIYAPYLKFFKYSGEMNAFCIAGDLPSIEEAEHDFSLEYEFDGQAPIIYDLVQDLSSARVLTVCSHLLQVIPNGDDPSRIRSDLNVRHLILNASLHQNEFHGIAFMLNSCPKLEYLTIQICLTKVLLEYMPAFRFDHEIFWSNHAVYECLKSSLKEVEIKNFTGARNEILMLTYFIVCGKLLKKMIINIVKDDSDPDGMESYHRGMAQVLLTVPRASNELEILII